MLSSVSAMFRTCARTVSKTQHRFLSRTPEMSQTGGPDRSSNVIKIGEYPKVHYEKAGSGEHVVLMIPGALGTTKTDFEPQLAGLDREKFTLLALDLPGYGKSLPPERQWGDKFLHHDSDTTAQFMKTLGYHRFSILGWSDGGNVGMILAAKYPEVMRKLVVWGANSYITKEELDVYDSIADIDKWSAKMRQGFVDVYGEHYFRKHWSQWIAAVKAYYHNYNGNLFRESLPLIGCPTLIIHGDQDAMVPGFHPEYLQKHIKNSRLVRWPQGKHNLHLRFADDFKTEVEKFLQED